ncbi:MAG: hypothetical protein WAT20_05040 [Ferruginibacter sp.]|nr:hypothetical protein [Chitinophagaceae bacterium]
MRRVIIIICLILAAVIFALLVVRQNYKNSPDYNYIAAKLDIRNKNARIINIGLRKPSSKDNEIDSIEAEYGFKNIYIGYDTTKQIVSGINNYNQVTEAYLKLRNGSDWRENYQRKVDSLYKAASR